jgi:GWxTD domain-containing protein
MNALLFLVHTPIAKALGWTLVHSLWEGALIAALVAAGFLVIRPASARSRYALACAGMLAMLIAFVVTLATLWPAPAAPIAIPISGALRAAPADAIAFPAPHIAPSDRLPWIVPFWMLGVLGFYVRTAGGWLAAQRLRGRGTIAAPAEWQDRLRALAARLRVMRPVVLFESCLAETPVLIGFLRPAILIPAGLLAGLAPDQLEAILLHELAHIRRHDYAVNLMQSLVEGLLFYHPAVWWLSSVVRAERENCCDDAVVALRGDAAGYAAALAALEQRRAASQPALAATGGHLMKRIRRLLEPNRPRTLAGPALAAILLLAPIAAGLSAWPAKPQTPVTPIRKAAPPVLLAQAQPPQTPASSPAVVNDERNPFIEQFWLRRDQPIQVAQAAPPQTPQAEPGILGRPLSEEEKKANARKLEKELQTPYKKWMNEDVAYIITQEERDAFKNLQKDDEREHFIEQFWLRRDPTPGTTENEFKEEYYRRIAYANEHFLERGPGWKTDRGRIYITYGPPDEIDNRRAGPTASDTYPVQQWRYRLIDGWTDVTIEFVDATGTGEFHMTMDPSERIGLFADPVQRKATQALENLDNQIRSMEDLLAFMRRTHTDDFPAVREQQVRIEELRAQRERLAAQISTAR